MASLTSTGMLPLEGRALLPLSPVVREAFLGPIKARALAAKSIDVYITHLCNRRCTYCFLTDKYLDKGNDSADHSRHMSLDVAEDIFRWAAAGGVEEVTLLGGEPSLHPHFGQLIRMPAWHGLKVRVVTNGHPRFQQLLAGDTDIARILRQSRVAVSLDTPDAALFDRCRGRNAFRDATTAMYLLGEQGIPFDINATITQSVLATVPALMRYADGVGSKRLNIHWYSSTGRGAVHAPNEVPTPEEWARVLLQVMTHRSRRKDFVVDCEIAFWYAVQGADTDMCAVRDLSNLQFFPNGDVFSCGVALNTHQSGYVWRDHGLYQRLATPTEITATANPIGRCPIRSQDAGSPAPLCIYNRVETMQSNRPPANRVLQGDDRWLIPGGHRFIDGVRYSELFDALTLYEQAGVSANSMSSMGSRRDGGRAAQRLALDHARDRLGRLLIREQATIGKELRAGGCEWWLLAAHAYSDVRLGTALHAKGGAQAMGAMRRLLREYELSAISRTSESVRKVKNSGRVRSVFGHQL